MMDTSRPQLSPFQRLRYHLASLPKPHTEESIALRILVQALVIVGIIATDLAASTQISFWAVPLSIIGGFWSWFRRKKANITMKFIIAIGMILAMGYFFTNLLDNFNDTRLVLAELLIQLQVLHSFDLPRRKDLGYSTTIGLILLGVAGTLSETLAFAPVLLIFLVVALPVLILDYRSRLGFRPHRRSPSSSPSEKVKILQYSPLSPKRLTLFILITLALGLTIFAIMPRFPGYQLQTFPVSSPVDLDNERFNRDNQGIVNPGGGRNGQNNNPNNGQGNNGQGQGEGDPIVYYGFNRQFDQGSNLQQARQLIPKVVLRVRSQAPGFWRVLGFDRYTGRGWEVSREDQLVKIERPAWTYRFDLGYPLGVAPTKSVIQTYTVVQPLPNLVPALASPRSLYFPTPEIGIDPEGSIRAPSTLDTDLTYTAVSEVALRDRTLLGKANTTYPNNIRKYYLQIPDKIKDKIKEQTEKILAKSPKPLANNYEKTLFLAQAVKQQYEVTGDFFIMPSEDIVETFLFRHKGGYPDHFATALTIMLRSIGIPARLAVGFDTGEFNPFTGFYLVRNTDAFALTEVYFPPYGWFSFNPLPGYDLIPQSIEDNETFGVVRQIWNWIAGWLPSPVTSFIGYLWQMIINSLAWVVVKLWQFISSSILGLLTGLIGAIVFLLLAWLGLLRFLQWQKYRYLGKLHPMERLYRLMVATLSDRGYPKHPAQTPLEYTHFLQSQTFPLADLAEEISQAYLQWRYGGEAQNVKILQQKLKQILHWRPKKFSRNL